MGAGVTPGRRLGVLPGQASARKPEGRLGGGQDGDIAGAPWT